MPKYLRGWIHKNQYGFGSAIAIVVAIAGLIAIFFIFGEVGNHLHKKALDKELSMINPPQSCIETRRYYQGPSIDAISEWHISYNCKNSYQDIYNRLKNDIKTNGYSVVYDKPWVERTGKLFGFQLCFNRQSFQTYYVYDDNSNVVDHGSPVPPSFDMILDAKNKKCVH